MRKTMILIVVTALLCNLMTGCSGGGKDDNKRIVLWSSGEDYKNEN